MEMVNIKINNMPPERTQKDISIHEAARYAGIEIPTLCYLKDMNEIGACRICMVEVKGARSLVSACVFPVNEGMEVLTNTEKVRKRAAGTPLSWFYPPTGRNASPAYAAATASFRSSAATTA